MCKIKQIHECQWDKIYHFCIKETLMDRKKAASKMLFINLIKIHGLEMMFYVIQASRNHQCFVNISVNGNSWQLYHN